MLYIRVPISLIEDMVRVFMNGPTVAFMKVIFIWKGKKDLEHSLLKMARFSRLNNDSAAC